MTDEIRPALTPEEWTPPRVEKIVDTPTKPGYVDHRSWVELQRTGPTLRDVTLEPGERTRVVIHGNGVDPEIRHATAALCLYGQPFGFTQEDVDFLRQQASGAEASDSRGADVGAFTDLADRIAALLPPKG